MFSSCLENFLLFSSDLKLSSTNCFNLDVSKILSFGNGLKTEILFEMGRKHSGKRLLFQCHLKLGWCGKELKTSLEKRSH